MGWVLKVISIYLKHKDGQFITHLFLSFVCREAKGKWEIERYTHLNADFQKIARRDKIYLLRDQWKEIEENNRMGKTRDLLRKFRDTKGTFHAQLGTIKERSGMYLTEAEDIKKRWQEYTEELYKNLHDWDNPHGVTTHLSQASWNVKSRWP